VNSLHRTTIALTVSLAAIAPLFALSYPLSSTDIRDAYFIGRRNDDVTISFLNTYARHFEPPAKGAYITEIGIETPFVQIVEKSMGTADYSAPAAVLEFQGRRMRFLAHVILFEPITAAGKKPGSSDHSTSVGSNFWRDYKVKLIQGREREVQPISIDGSSIYTSNAGVMGTYTYNSSGARIDLEFASDKIEADDTKITVDGPNGEHFEADFDLAALR
jgi:hypothetical protein